MKMRKKIIQVKSEVLVQHAFLPSEQTPKGPAFLVYCILLFLINSSLLKKEVEILPYKLNIYIKF